MRCFRWFFVAAFFLALAGCPRPAHDTSRDAEAFVNRGNAWYQKQEYDRAISEYDEAIRLNPQYAMAYNNRGNAWYAQKDYDKAIRDYDEAIRLDAKYALAFNNRGIAWQNKKDYDNAIKDYDEAIRLDPKYGSAYYNRGVTWEIQEDYDKAIKDYDEAIRLDPKNANSYIASASLLATCRDLKYRDGKRAIELATKACDLTEWKNAEWIDTLADAYAESGDFDAAVKWAKKAIELGKDASKETLDRYKKHLELYEEKKPLRDD